MFPYGGSHYLSEEHEMRILLCMVHFKLKKSVTLDIFFVCLIQVCGECDREDRMLLCDGCDLGYHLECLDPPMDTVPLEEWFCPDCVLSNSFNLAEEVMTLSWFLYFLFPGSQN